MVSPDDEIMYSRRYLRIRAIFVFNAYIFLFLAAGTEIIDVASAYFNITISPRVALLILVTIQSSIWIIIELHNKPNALFIIAGSIVTYASFLIAETEIGEFIFFDSAAGMRNLNTIIIFANVIMAAAYATNKDFNNKLSQQQKYTD
ncbi:MAG: hypothetical protein CL608_27070 [Anaerolineaceae bacterium]|nr:hypothetical protein [Anaerolineaceae bacterium]